MRGAVAALVCLLASGKVLALELAVPFGDAMVLPADERFPVWGSALPGAKVEATLGPQHRSAVAAADGRWRIEFEAEPATCDGRELVVSSGTERVVLRDVVMGELWLCSGQSNMDFPLRSATGGEQEAAGAGRFPGIRLCNRTGVSTAGRPYGPAERQRLNVRQHFQGQWQRASQESAGAVSAVAWWTARIHHERTGVPVGLVENAVGGSGAEAWLPLETLEAREDYRPLRGEDWLNYTKVSPWARQRARLNLGPGGGCVHPFQPGFLFESGVRPWVGLPWKRVLWYQGETNAELDDDAWNERLLEDLVTGWRRALGCPSLPFHMVQLPRIGGKDPLRARWPQFREVQARVAARVPAVFLIVTQDLGWDSPDVHPPDKRPVAERLAASLRKEQEK